MAKRHDRVHRVKDDWVFEHPVIVELAQILDLSNPPLVESEVVLLQPQSHGLDHLVNNPNDKGGVVPIERAKNNSEEMNVAVSDFSRLRKDLVECSHNLLGISDVLEPSCVPNKPPSPPSGVGEFA